ncbi:ENV1 protein, partial [Hylia prasina]|nr:ENV1 protein [Hylia prasina]
KSDLCSEIITLSQRETHKWLIPSANTLWICHNIGVTPCLYLSKFNPFSDFCIQAVIFPKVLYHSEEEIYQLYEEPNHRQKREVITITLSMLLGLGVATGIGTGTAAIIKTNQRYEQIQEIIDEDLQRTELAISNLEKSLSSLAEVVLQNRRGLDVIFMKEGGLCAALKEECCFYADHTGVVRDSMAELRKRLSQRKEQRASWQNWFEAWYNSTPWLASLITSFIGPITILMLILIFGPCTLNKLTAFIENRLQRFNVLMME